MSLGVRIALLGLIAVGLAGFGLFVAGGETPEARGADPATRVWRSSTECAALDPLDPVTVSVSSAPATT